MKKLKVMIEFEKSFIEKLTQDIKEKNYEAVKAATKDLYPADVAELFTLLSLNDTITVYSLLDGEVAADALMELDEDERGKILDRLSNEQIAQKFIDNMDTDDAVDLMRELDENQQDDILSHIKDVEQAGEILDLLRYDEDTAGGFMSTEMIVINENWSMPKCVHEMRMQAEELDELYYIYVVDDKQRLQGVLPIKKVITNPSVAKVKHVMKRDPIAVRDDDPVEDAINAIEKYDLVAVPVVDSLGRLLGIITVDDVVDKMRDMHERDYQLASGLSQDVESSDSVWRQTAARLPWLLIGMAGGIGNSIILGGYESVFASNPSLPLFIPLIGGTGGNVGIQSSAIVVQGLANNSIKDGALWKLVTKEMIVSLINASIISLVVFIYNYFYIKDMVVMASVSISLFAVVMFASIFGTFVPMMLDRFKVDPARATGPFITITNDLIGMFIYMLITTLLTSHYTM